MSSGLKDPVISSHRVLRPGLVSALQIRTDQDPLNGLNIIYVSSIKLYVTSLTDRLIHLENIPKGIFKKLHLIVICPTIGIIYDII